MVLLLISYFFTAKLKTPSSSLDFFSDGFANIDPTTIDLDKLQKEIIDFHEKYYSANIMTLAVISLKILVHQI